MVRFADRERHLIFLEPEGLDTDEVYVNGVSTSLPADTQVALIRSIAGLERAELVRYGYAVEYDSVPSWQVRATLESKPVAGLYLAGQILGTSGYEEAAAQGLVAGVNACRDLTGAGALASRAARILPRCPRRRPGHQGDPRTLPHVHVARGAPAASALRQRGDATRSRVGGARVVACGRPARICARATPPSGALVALLSGWRTNEPGSGTTAARICCGNRASILASLRERLPSGPELFK